MLKNDLAKESKIKLIENNITQAQIAEKLNVSRPYISALFKRDSLVNETFVKVMELAGYDIELIFHKRSK